MPMIAADAIIRTARKRRHAEIRQRFRSQDGGLTGSSLPTILDSGVCQFLCQFVSYFSKTPAHSAER